jgi:hypothetical protein
LIQFFLFFRTGKGAFNFSCSSERGKGAFNFLRGEDEEGGDEDKEGEDEDKQGEDEDKDKGKRKKTIQPHTKLEWYLGLPLSVRRRQDKTVGRQDKTEEDPLQPLVKIDS